MSEHDHEHDHVHEHAHSNCSNYEHEHSDDSPEMNAAMLRYMIDHNKHHADELYDLANKLDGEAREKVHAAVIDFEKGNTLLEEALGLVDKEAK